MKIEFLIAKEDKTWDTVIEEVPDRFMLASELDPIVIWAQLNLAPQTKYRKIVFWGVYNENPEEEND